MELSFFFSIMDDNVEVVEHLSSEEDRNGENRERWDRQRRERLGEGEELRNELFAYLDLKFDQQRDENEELKRKLRKQESKLTKFNQKGHEVQFKFNLSVLEKAEDLEAAIKKGRKTKLQETQLQEVGELKKMLEKRNKLIKIADRSELGWKTVREYESDEIADDSADEKRLKAAEKAAAAKDRHDKAQKEKSGKVQSKMVAAPRVTPYATTRSSTITRRPSNLNEGGASR